jgi:hypothetical protein
METMKSELNLMVKLTTDLLTDIADELGASCSLDAREIARRTTSEGPSFLTKRLPALGKALDKCLSKPNTQMDYTGFKLRAGYPEFLGFLFKRVFDRTGRSLCDVDPNVIGHIRQILYLWYKYELPYTPSQEETIEKGFLDTEAALPDEVPKCPVIQGARDLIGRVMSGFSYEAITPRHGPGAVATRERVWEKYRFKRLYQNLERFFPFTEWFIPTLSYLVDRPGYRKTDRSSPLEYLTVCETGTARAVFVPKDSRGPRLISCEPLEYQWIQQGVAAEVIRCINGHPYTSGRVNFTDQRINRVYALMGSMGAGWVTLDMKDASDRVTKKLVERLFGGSVVCQYLLSCRTDCTVLPSGQTVALKKFAPMGSALCFPVESLVFFALAVNVIVHHVGVPLKDALNRVKVYGDDLVCSSEDYAAIMQYFPHVGLAFNEAKCCTDGSFRESCGLDAFSGVDVTPVKIRTRLVDQQDAQTVASAVSYGNVLDQRGYWRAAQSLRDWLAAAGGYASTIPYLLHEDKAVAYLVHRTHFSKYVNLRKAPVRWNLRFWTQETLGVVVQGLAVKRVMPGWERLFANIANNPPRSLVPFRNRDVGHTSAVLSHCPSTVIRQQLRWTADREHAVGWRTVMFPLRRRVTLIRRWCA